MRGEVVAEQRLVAEFAKPQIPNGLGLAPLSHPTVHSIGNTLSGHYPAIDSFDQCFVRSYNQDTATSRQFDRAITKMDEDMTSSENFERAQVALHKLIPLEMPAHRARRPEIEQLSDQELVAAVRQPANSDYVVINLRTGKLHDGNGRIHELLRRAEDSDSIITSDITIPVESYLPDLSMFPDL